MTVSKDFLNYVLDLLSSWGNIYTKRMFGGVALYRDDLAFGMVFKDEVYLKVDESNSQKYIHADSKQLRPFDRDAVVVSFYSVPPDIFEDSDEFISWAKESLVIQKKRKL